MAPLKVKVNTLVKENPKPFKDLLSKIYIILECIFGVNRLPVILKERYCYIFTFLTFVYCFVASSLIVYQVFEVEAASISMCVEYMFCVTFSFISWKRMERYYEEINKFDIEIGCRPRMTTASLWNLILVSIFTGSIVFGNALCAALHLPTPFQYLLITRSIIHCFEYHYYGHLLSLLTPRLNLINYYVESALSSGKLAKRPDIEEFTSFKSKNNKNGEITTLMDFYEILIKAYDFLMEAIKWQLLVILVTSFIITLTHCYHLALSVMRSEDPFLDIVMDTSVMATELVPLFAPCLFGDRVYNEVTRLRELLASRLYENKLNKCGRSAARALLALTEARDLSFSLLRMLQIDISLPFKFIGLLITYLIILVQFEKVINPSSSATNVTTTIATIISTTTT